LEIDVRVVGSDKTMKGAILPFTGRIIDFSCSLLTKVVSLNCSFNSLNHKTASSYRVMVRDLFMEGVHYVCLNDFPAEKIQMFQKLGYIYSCEYGQGEQQLFQKLSHIIIVNPELIHFDDDCTNVTLSFTHETHNIAGRNLICGCFMIQLNGSNSVIGSVYDNYLSSHKIRKSNWLSRLEMMESNPDLNYILAGDFNLRSKYRMIDSMWSKNSKSFDGWRYKAKMIPFGLVSALGLRFLGTESEREVAKQFGCYFPRLASSFRWISPEMSYNSKITCDGIQTNLREDSFRIDVLDFDWLPTDHRPIMTTVYEMN
jgi:hypothetical protein